MKCVWTGKLFIFSKAVTAVRSQQLIISALSKKTETRSQEMSFIYYWGIIFS